MADPLSYQHAINVVRLLYERSGFEMHGKTPGQDVTKEAGDNVSEAKLGALFALIDELIFLVRYQCYYLTSCTPLSEGFRAVAYLRCCTGILSTLWSIRIMSGMGLDLNARVQLRYLYELVILWSRLQVDNEALEQFSQTSINDTNAFWHKYLARRKSEKYLVEGVESGRFAWHGALGREHLDDIHERLGLSGHPGLWGLLFETSADFKKSTDHIVRRHVDDATPFTLSSALFLSVLPFGVNGVSDWQFQAANVFEPNKIYPALPRASNWGEYCLELRKIMLGVALVSFRFTTELARKEQPQA